MRTKLTCGCGCVAILLTSISSAWAQQYYGTPNFARYGNGYGGYGGFGFGGYGFGAMGAGSTPMGSALLGAGYFAQGMGQFTAMASQSAVNYQQAYSMWLDNAKKAEATYFDMRRMNASYRAEMGMQRPHPTPEQIVEFNKSRVPSSLPADQWDPTQGVFKWPGVLQGNEFKTDRSRIEQLFADRANDPYHSGLGSQNYRDIEHAVNDMSDKLHARINQLGADEYIAANRFLKSVGYEARFSPSEQVVRK